MYPRLALLLLAGLALELPTAAGAQNALFDPNALANDCRIKTCQKTLLAILNDLDDQQLDADQLNAQLGMLASVLLDAGRDDSFKNAKHVAGALTVLARRSSDELQKSTMRRVALAVARGEMELLDPADPFSVSPS